MAYTNPRGIGVSDQGPTLVTLCACTLTDYTVAGTTTPVVGDGVAFSATGDMYVARLADEVATGPMGRVTKIAVAPVGSAVGYLAVEWDNVIRLRSFPCATLANATRGNKIEKAGDTSVAADYDAPDSFTAGSNILCVAKSAATGVGTLLGAVCI